MPAKLAGKEIKMGHEAWSFLGMHVFWWLFWIAAVVAFFALFAPGRWLRSRETPLEVLQRRYAAGELSSQEYEERKVKLQRDRAARNGSRAQA